jgi:hypothetical protein
MARQRLSWNLPIPVEMKGRPGLRINQLRGLLHRHIQEWNQPAFMVIHMGANDIGSLSTKQWIEELDVCVLYLRARYPATQLIWSDMIPRLSWRHCVSVKGAENARKRNQRRARALFWSEGGKVISHPKISTGPDLLSDGVHLSEVGQGKFHTDLQDGLQEIIGNLWA